jgi:tRNA G18 (ribose-2'-O)-methylase SpoU
MARHKRRRDIEEQAQWLFRRHKNANLLARPGAHEFIVVIDHVKSDFNIGKIFRSADAFGAREVHLIGVDSFNPASAMGSFKWVPARFHNHIAQCYKDLSARGYVLYTLEPQAEQALGTIHLPLKSAFIIGHEEYGLSFERRDYPLIQALSIAQFGRVQSLNVSVAASIAMYEYVKQHAS